MNEKQKSFILYNSDLKCLRYLTDEQAGVLFKAIAAIRNDEDLPDLGTDAALMILFDQISTHMAINDAKYKEICERRSAAARKRWSTAETMPENANASTCIQKDTNGCYNDNVNENENDNENENENENDNDIVNVNVIDNDIDAFSMNAKKPKEENQKTIYDLSSVESFFLSAKQVQHPSSS